MSDARHILVAVDFNNATEPLMDFVSKDISKGDRVTLLYVLNQGYMGVNLTSGYLPFDQESRKLREITSRYFSDVEVDNQVGFDPNSAADGIVRFASQHDVDRIYIGSRDRHHLLDRLLGSTCLQVVNQAPCDVVVVPYGAQHRPTKKFVLAASEGISDLLSEERLKNWKGKHAYFVHIAHGEKDDFSEEQKKILAKLFDENDVDFTFGIESVVSQNTVKSILSFAHSEGADRVLLRKSNQSLISTLFLSSTTKEIIEKSVIPLIFLTTKS
jgi:nucleotide-binding universal stress UspA family protein